MVGVELVQEGLSALAEDFNGNLVFVVGMDTVHNIIWRDSTVGTKPCFETPSLHLGRYVPRENRKVPDAVPKYFCRSPYGRHICLDIRRGVVFVKYSREIPCAPACLIDMGKVAQRAVHGSWSPENHVVAIRLGAKKQRCKFQGLLMSCGRIEVGHLS